MRLGMCLALVWTLIGSAAATAQSVASRPNPRPAVRGIVQTGGSWLSAKDSFEAITGGSRTRTFGGGVQVANVWRGLFAQVDVTRANMTGERVFMHAGTVYPMGIPVDITMMPIEVSSGYRVWTSRGRVAPYVGGGVGFFGYRETSPFAGRDEEINERFRSWHVLGGVELPVLGWLAAGGEVRYRVVSNALGVAGVSAELREHDLGGVSLGVRVTVGR